MKVKIEKTNSDVPTPAYQTAGAAGCDVTTREDVTIDPLGVKAVPTGIFLEVPEGYECQVRPRSGLAMKGLTVINSPGTIDSDYRGELKVILHNTTGTTQFLFKKGDRIAQLVFAPVTRAEFDVVDELSVTDRGAGGFGSTGKS